MDYQTRGVEFIESHEAVLIGDSMGLGKTVQALAFADKVGAKTLVICPAFLIPNWNSEIKKFLVKSKATFQVLSYEALKKQQIGFFKHFDLVVVDECHYIANLSAQRTKALHSQLKNNPPKFFVALSGTAIKNRVSEFYSILKLLSLHPTNKNGVKLHNHFTTFEEFAEYFCYDRIFYVGPQENIPIRKFYGIKNIQVLQKILKKKYIRRLADNVLELPDLITKYVQADIKGHKKLDKTLDLEFREQTALSTVKKESAVLKSEFTAKYVLELLEEVKSVIVFSHHIEPVELIYKELNKKHPVLKITADLNPQKRKEVVDMFQKGSARVLVATIGTAGTGFNITNTSNLVFNDVSWTPNDNAQAVGRIHRFGQTHKCVVHKIVGSEVDKFILKTLEEKEAVLTQVL